MFGFSYGEILLLVGATAAVIGPKDLPIIARTAGRLAGRAIGYVQLARGQFENIMQQSQARQVHKELQDTMAQLEAIRHEIRSISVLNPGPMTRRLVDNLDQMPASDVNKTAENVQPENLHKAPEVSFAQTNGTSMHTATISKISNLPSSESCDIHSQAVAYAKLAEMSALKPASSQTDVDDADLSNVLPVSAESAGLLPNRQDDIRGSDIVLEAVLEADVAQNAKNFFSQPQNQIKFES